MYFTLFSYLHSQFYFIFNLFCHSVLVSYQLTIRLTISSRDLFWRCHGPHHLENLKNEKVAPIEKIFFDAAQNPYFDLMTCNIAYWLIGWVTINVTFGIGYWTVQLQLVVASVALPCTTYCIQHVYCAIYTMQCTLYYCTPCQCTLYKIHCTIYTV